VKNVVHSFDLVAKTSGVVACDIAHVPLPDNSVDIVVFCLSLMGTIISDFLKEAYRILKPGGVMRIAEVRSP
jgi:ribosomal RNA-processing protein 8